MVHQGGGGAQVVIRDNHDIWIKSMVPTSGKYPFLSVFRSLTSAGATKTGWLETKPKCVLN